jgi:hypothetical protein
MIELLQTYDRKTAAGLLARAALVLENGDGVRLVPIVENEESVRAALISDARKQLGIEENDERPEIFDEIGSYLEGESNRLMGDKSSTAAFERLSEKGDLPSDLYEIEIVPNIRDFWGDRFEREKSLIERTIRKPNQEQHFGLPVSDGEPHLVSLFARDFKADSVARSFRLLVAAQRGFRLKLHVHQAWRLYPSVVKLQGASDLIEQLKRFADAYGGNISLGGQQGPFFLSSDMVAPNSVLVQSDGKPMRLTITQFVQWDRDGNQRAALVSAIDLEKYRKTLARFDSNDIR